MEKGVHIIGEGGEEGVQMSCGDEGAGKKIDKVLC